jgi:hypothetical protein
MRNSVVVVLGLIVAGVALGAAGPRIEPKDASHHRAQLVTLVGEVTDVGSGGDSDVFLHVGNVAVRVPDRARDRFPRDPRPLLHRTVEVTGFVSPPGRPLAVVLERPEELVPRQPVEAGGLAERVSALEGEVDRLRAVTPREGESGIVYGPVSPPSRPLPRYVTQATVLAEHGVPTRVDWSNDRRVLYYGREAWLFDEQGQLVEVRGD